MQPHPHRLPGCPAGVSAKPGSAHPIAICPDATHPIAQQMGATQSGAAPKTVRRLVNELHICSRRNAKRCNARTVLHPCPKRSTSVRKRRISVGEHKPDEEVRQSRNERTTFEVGCEPWFVADGFDAHRAGVARRRDLLVHDKPKLRQPARVQWRHVLGRPPVLQYGQGP